MRLCWQSNNWSNIDSEDQTANSEPSNCTARPFLPRYRLYTSNYIARPCVNWKHWRLFVMCSQSCLIQEFLLEVFSFYSVCRNSHIAQWGEKKNVKTAKTTWRKCGQEPKAENRQSNSFTSARCLFMAPLHVTSHDLDFKYSLWSSPPFINNPHQMVDLSQINIAVKFSPLTLAPHRSLLIVETGPGVCWEGCTNHVLCLLSPHLLSLFVCLWAAKAVSVEAEFVKHTHKKKGQIYVTMKGNWLRAFN